MKKLLLSALLFWGASGAAYSEQSTDSTETSTDSSLVFNWASGVIDLKEGNAKLTVPAGFRFLDAKQSQFVLEELWGNLKDESVLGMLFPEDANPLEGNAWGYVVSFQDVGYVKDDDADDIDYEELAEQQKEDSKAANEERSKLGLSTLEFVGWAENPYYDKDKKVLFWAKEFKVSDSEENTLNYDIRILGRKGLMSLNAVAGMSNLAKVKASAPAVISGLEFTEGNRYADFNESTDQIAAWTIGGLVAGKLLAKAGFFALILKNIKLVVIGLLAGGAALFRFITGRKKETPAVETAAQNNDNQEAPQQ